MSTGLEDIGLRVVSEGVRDGEYVLQCDLSVGVRAIERVNAAAKVLAAEIEAAPVGLRPTIRASLREALA